MKGLFFFLCYVGSSCAIILFKKLDDDDDDNHQNKFYDDGNFNNFQIRKKIAFVERHKERKKESMCLCLFVSSLSLAEIRTRWWLHPCGMRKPTYNMVLNYLYQQQPSFWLAPTSLKYRKYLLNFGGYFFCVLGLGLDMGLVSIFFPRFLWYPSGIRGNF